MKRLTPGVKGLEYVRLQRIVRNLNVNTSVKRKERVLSHPLVAFSFITSRPSALTSQYGG